MRRAAWLLACLVGISGCGALETESSSRTIRVGTLGLVDSAPLHLAIENGHFAAEGLTVELTTGAKGSANVDNVLGGSLDFGLTSYPPALTPHAKGVADLRIVADAVQTTENLILLAVHKDRQITHPSALPGRKVAVSSKRGISELALNAQLRAMSVDHTGIQYVSMEIASMPSALERGDVAAAVIAEPHLSAALRTNLVELMDPFTGPTADFPWSGWITTKQFADTNPDTVAKFRRALGKGVAETADHAKVRDVLRRNLKIDQPDMTMPVFPTEPDPARLQRVADLMYAEGEIDKQIDVRTMVLN